MSKICVDIMSLFIFTQCFTHLYSTSKCVNFGMTTPLTCLSASVRHSQFPKISLGGMPAIASEGKNPLSSKYILLYTCTCKQNCTPQNKIRTGSFDLYPGREQ